MLEKLRKIISHIGHFNSRSIFSASTAATPTTTPTVITAYWSFDFTTNDAFGVYNGTLINNATYLNATTTLPYVGNAPALFLSNPTSTPTNSSFLISSFLNLSYRSFTVEAWIYATSTFSGDNSIFSQCQCTTCPNQCLSLLVRSGRLYMGFGLNDISGLTSLAGTTWYHVAFVYNYETMQQILYLNGVQDRASSSSAPYQGQSGVTQIGVSQSSTSQSTLFNGYIDNVRVTTRAKSAAEIYNAATLMAYYSFDLPNQVLDSGPNGLHGIQYNTALVAGRVNQAMRFTGTGSFFQAYGFYTLAWGVVSNRPFTIAMWLNPSSTGSSVVIQVSPFQNSTYSPAYIMNLIGFISTTGTNTGQLVTQLYAWQSIFGPYLPLNTWSHVVFTFSSTRGNSQYVNGALVAATGATTSGNVWGSIMWLQVGYAFCWSSAYIPCTGYQGSVDELYIYNRELSASEVWALANP